MSVLFPFLPFDLAETPLSFATRLANFHLRSTVVPFLHDIGVRPDALLGCEVDAVERLAAVAGVDSAALHRNSTRRIGKRRYDLRGHVLSAEFFSCPDTVFCPACLKEDDMGATDVGMARRGRLGWTLRPVRTCPRHGLALIYRQKERWDDKYHELARRVPEEGDALDRLIDGVQQRLPSPLQVYVTARLDGAAGPSWLDSQSLEQAVRAAEMLGMLIELGPSAKPADLGPKDWDRAGRAGYAVTSAGEGAIRDALHVVQAEFRGRGGKPGRRKIFGATYEWLSSTKNRKEPGDIMRIMREHIFATMEVAPGEAILGGTLAERRLHSVESLATESGLNSRTLRNVLAASGLIPVEDKVSDHHVFDAEAGRKVAASVRRLTHVISLPRALNCTRPQADQLLDERLLAPISDRPGTAVGRTWKAVDKTEIGRFLDALHARAYPVEVVPPGLVTIAKAAEKAKAPSVEIVHLVLCGFLENVARRRDVDGYAAILVDPDEVRIQIGARMRDLSASSAFARLKLPKSTGWTLVLREDEPRLQPDVVEGENGLHRFYRFTEKSVSAFMSEFTTVARIADEGEIWGEAVASRLKKARVRPALARREVGVDLYRVAEIPEFEPA